jgi:hypothetical protein
MFFICFLLSFKVCNTFSAIFTHSRFILSPLLFTILLGNVMLKTQNCLKEFIAEFPNVIVDRKTFEDNLSRCVKLFRETGDVYRRKTTGVGR